MKCSRCSAELPDSATYCFQCGQNFPSATQSASSQHQSGSFSYLPAGTPPWPTSAPTLTPKVTSIAQPGVVEFKASSQPKRSTASVLMMIGLALLVPILGAALTMGTLFARGQISSGTPSTSKGSVPTTQQQQQPTPQATPAANQLPTPTSSRKISDNDLNMLLQYPNNWDAEQIYKTSSSTSLDIHPHQPLNMTFQVVHLADTISSQFQSPNDVNQNMLQALVQQLSISTIQPISSTNAQPTISGTTWSQQEEAFQVSNGDTYHLTMLSTQHNKSYYSIFYFTPQIYYSEAMTKYMQPILQSLQFIK
jgi:hypothetical protein